MGKDFISSQGSAIGTIVFRPHLANVLSILPVRPRPGLIGPSEDLPKVPRCCSLSYGRNWSANRPPIFLLCSLVHLLQNGSNVW